MDEYARRAVSLTAILVVLLGLVFALMYWWGRDQVDNTARESLKTDLRNLGVAESVYFERHQRYTTVLKDLPGFKAVNDVSVEQADANSWHASAVHTRTSQSCTFGRDDPAMKCN